MSSQSRNPFLRLPVSVGNEVYQHLIHADQIVQITEHDELSTDIELVNGKQYLVELTMSQLEQMLNQAYGHELTRPSLEY